MTTLREHWAQSPKLLLVLSDRHVERMLRAKEAGGPPRMLFVSISRESGCRGEGIQAGWRRPSALSTYSLPMICVSESMPAEVAYESDER